MRGRLITPAERAKQGCAALRAIKRKAGTTFADRAISVTGDRTQNRKPLLLIAQFQWRAIGRKTGNHFC
ncbi:hypothetical protein [Mesorhizobium sp. M1D.F.Ca.ET.043.01.1.1]|uniref:hypothetical protein n=1 Tax=Mesorhizobium sp. M1D.F.Ca.ET.043.01.1.1 TaxID=2493669 RepID=UPI000F74F07E|nr:hypothetical protein [Mesorhizobium sp. M1D.F.Ca.ET.043.01.1.1]AZO75178.1 hypothetical protein EJ067_31410 [Mesorhizobium sp. M1D.F.Ca.ET.043.01.1.1]